MTTTIIVGVVAFIGGFVFGVLFARRNTQKVEKTVAAIEAKVAAIEAKIK